MPTDPQKLGYIKRIKWSEISESTQWKETAEAETLKNLVQPLISNLKIETAKPASLLAGGSNLKSLRIGYYADGTSTLLRKMMDGQFHAYAENRVVDATYFRNIDPLPLLTHVRIQPSAHKTPAV